MKSQISIENVSKVFGRHKALNNVSLEIVIQDPKYGLGEYLLPEKREKPWGTGQAILCCENVIEESFITINADDFYGYGAFEKAYETLNHIESNNIKVSTISYLIENTLSENGGVSRGVCIIEGNKLINIEETHDLIRNGNIVEGNFNGGKVQHPIGTKVAMNLFGFQKSIFSLLNKEFKIFLNKNINEPKKEFLLPEVVGKENVFVDVTDENWFGVTYKNDSDTVKNKIKNLKNTPIKIDVIVILKKRSTKRLLNLKKLFFFRKINNKIELNQEEIVVAIGIIIKPIELKYITLIKIFKNTDTTDI